MTRNAKPLNLSPIEKVSKNKQKRYSARDILLFSPIIVNPSNEKALPNGRAQLESETSEGQ